MVLPDPLPTVTAERALTANMKPEAQYETELAGTSGKIDYPTWNAQFVVYNRTLQTIYISLQGTASALVNDFEIEPDRMFVSPQVGFQTLYWEASAAFSATPRLYAYEDAKFTPGASAL